MITSVFPMIRGEIIKKNENNEWFWFQDFIFSHEYFNNLKTNSILCTLKKSAANSITLSALVSTAKGTANIMGNDIRPTYLPHLLVYYCHILTHLFASKIAQEPHLFHPIPALFCPARNRECTMKTKSNFNKNPIQIQIEFLIKFLNCRNFCLDFS